MISRHLLMLPLLILPLASSQQLSIPAVSISSQAGLCPAVAELEKGRQIIREKVNNIFSQVSIPECGPGLWWRVAYLNMTDPSQQCPPAWREYNTSGVRACGRPVTSTGSCSATSYFTGRQYRRVCRRVIGYQVGSPDAFKRYANNGTDIDGINITHETQHNHIWSYVAGLT